MRTLQIPERSSEEIEQVRKFAIEFKKALKGWGYIPIECVDLAVDCPLREGDEESEWTNDLFEAYAVALVKCGFIK